MPTPTPESLLTVLQDHFSRREEGWVWLATFAEGRGVVNQVEGAFDEPVEAAEALAFIVNGLTETLRDLRVHIALCRAEGRPTEADRRMWRELRHRISPDVLIDMVIFNRDRLWSMRDEDRRDRLAV